MSCELSSQLV